ncbi:cytochrome c peroxidase [uncultured Pseudoteredinibacter sp.]|uniref:cytochrome-c peroxidase n=1 Tax=uncultured Pseudoteredinibacter sp. TaxID=1641701 RepID=UPI002604C80F|nr:cytochrome c peroxidase [uncultured Pseudoteredinibacter sp.]
MRLWIFLPLLAICIESAAEAPFSTDELRELRKQWLLPAPTLHPQHKQLSELGKKIFFDTNLSIDKSTSCASCHIPELGWSDGKPTAQGLVGKPLKRATPSIINTAYSKVLMWDGRADSLEQQALMPFFDPLEMGLNEKLLIAKIASNQEYPNLFERAFGDSAIDSARISSALAEFQRSITASNTRFDRWLKGDESALNNEEILGFKLFIDPQKAACAVCHHPPNFTDDGFHNIGLSKQKPEDLGRYRFTPIPLMKRAFKTPSLRLATRTAPYFHDGSAKTLLEVIEHYQEVSVQKHNFSPSLLPVNLNKEEKEKLLAFLNSLE